MLKNFLRNYRTPVQKQRLSKTYKPKFKVLDKVSAVFAGALSFHV